MKFRYVPPLFLVFLAATAGHSPAQTAASTQPNSSTTLSKQSRLELERAFQSELVYIRTPFPMGKKGLTLKEGITSPNGQDLQRMMTLYGPAVKPGDMARITGVDIKGDRIHFEINGGPVKKQKWYQRIQVGSSAGMAPIAPSDPNANPRGSYVDLVFEHYVPELDPPKLKLLLHPVFDFDAKSAVEAYLETLPPKLKDAIKNHQVLVGMNGEMVTYSKGRPPKKEREKDGETEYEEWIYGEPPQDVDFVRFVADRVVRVETMKVTGEKIVRTEPEIDLPQKPAVARAEGQQRPPNAPSLRRPGEELPNDSTDAPRSGAPSSLPPPQTTVPSSGGPSNVRGM